MLTSLNLGIAYAMLKLILIEGDISLSVLKDGTYIFVFVITNR